MIPTRDNRRSEKIAGRRRRVAAAAGCVLRRLPYLLLGLALTACTTGDFPRPTTTPDAGQAAGFEQRFEWKYATPESQGIDSNDLAAALERVARQDIELHGLIVYRNGHVVLEVYPPPYDAQTVHNIKSVSKSLLSAMVGIAVDKGIVDSIDRPVMDYFPDYVEVAADPHKNEILLRHLLTMTSGLELDENGPLMNAVFTSTDWIGATLQRPLVEPPGRRFNYSTALTHLMSGLLSRASDSSLLEFCRRYLCGPLGFEDIQWRTGPSGYYFGGAELYLRPRDMLKFGILYLDEGRWLGRQLVPRDWVRISTRDQLDGAVSERPYGFWWWPADDGYLGLGWGGQRLQIVPEKHLVIAATFADHHGFERTFEDFDFDKLSTVPLEPDPAAVDRLDAAIRALEQPAPGTVPSLPETALAISGKTFRLSSKTQTPSIKFVSFDFSRTGDYSLSIESDNYSGRLGLGLDGRYRVTPTGDFGRLPGNNKIALRGRWIGADTFELELLWVGEPLHTFLTLRFESERVVIEGQVRPAGVELHLLGTPSKRVIGEPST